MQTYCRRSNLIRLLSSDQCPTILKDAWIKIAKRLNIRSLDLMPAEVMSRIPSSPRGSQYGRLEPDIQAAFVNLLEHYDRSIPTRRSVHEVLLRNQHDQHGVSFMDFHTSLPHSLVYYHPDDLNKSSMKAAQIRAIFSHKRRGPNDELIDEIFFALHEYVPTDSQPFAAYPDFHVGVFHREVSSTVRVIGSVNVRCHANQLPWDETSVVMRPIDRVSPSYPVHLATNLSYLQEY